jgi:hypothetical protein
MIVVMAISVGRLSAFGGPGLRENHASTAHVAASGESTGTYMSVLNTSSGRSTKRAVRCSSLILMMSSPRNDSVNANGADVWS